MEQTKSRTQENDQLNQDHHHQGSYLRFFVMIGTSMVVMFF